MKYEKKLFVNLPITDIKRSREFFTQLGFTFHNDYSDDDSLVMVIEENIFAMLLLESKFKTFTSKEVVDAKKQTEVLLAVSVESKDKVNELVDKAVTLGGKETLDPADHGWMYYRQFEDLDGHIWEILWINDSEE